MNIWCISKYASLPKFGAGARLFYLAKEFSRKSHYVVLITSDSNHLCSYPNTNNRYNFDCLDGVNVCWIKNLKYKSTASIMRVVSWFDFEFSLFMLNKKKFNKPDVIIISSLSLLSIIYGYYLKNKFKAKLVFEVRDIWPLTLIEEGGISKFHPLSLFLGVIEKFAYNKSDLIVGTMPNLGEHVKNVIGYNRYVFCSPLGFHNDELTYIKKNNSFTNLFPDNKIIIGYAGSFGISNALQSFINVIKKMSSYNDVHFVLVGSGDLKNDYKDQLLNYENVTFYSKIKQFEVQSFLAHCDILYLSTKDSIVWDFGQSMNKVVQYMLSGKPIVASYSGYPSMINESDCGCFINQNNETLLLNTLLKYTGLNNAERESIGLKGKDWILINRSYSTLANNYLQQLDLLLKKDSLKSKY